MRIGQQHYEPGASVTVTATLSQFGIPLEQHCTVRATVTGPTGSPVAVTLGHTGSGVYEGSFPATHAGSYHVLVHADGFSLRGSSFTREQVRHAFVWRNGNRPGSVGPGSDRPDPDVPDVPDVLCDLLACLLSDKVLTPRARKIAEEYGIDLDALVVCVKRRCRDAGRPGAEAAIEATKGLRLDPTTYSRLVAALAET